MAGTVFDSPHSFSDSGLFFTLCGNDGKLKIWDTSTGILKQEYTKNFHLSSPCTCLTWLQVSKQTGTKKRKLKSTAQNVRENLDLIAVGTSSGNVMLYNVATNNVVTPLEGHTSKVNHLTWSKNNCLFSCSDDKHIIEWDIMQHKIKSKWKIGNEKLNCILALSDQKSILSASCSIKLWDIEKKQLLRTFIGHATEVISLLEVPERDGYFISAAKGDRVISAWSLKSNNDGSTPLASFVLQDGAASVHLASAGDDSPTTLCALNECGVLHVFRHKLNGNISKPLKPVTSITIASDSSSHPKQVSHPIPIQAVLSLHNGNMVIAYGNSAFLSFETISLADVDRENVVLLRQDKRRVQADEFNSKTKIPQANEETEYLGPVTTPVAKRSKHKELDVPLEERLENLALVKLTTEAPKKDSMAQLLIQGLQSKDRAIIQSVLLKNDEAIINSTVKQLPMQALVPLIRELMLLVHGKTFTSKCAAQWLLAVVRTNAGLLISNPDVGTIFEPLINSIEARLSVLPAMLRLRGRLNLISEQISNNVSQDVDEVNPPLISYQEQDSSDDEVEVDMASETSDPDENWDEFSEMEEEQEEDDEK